MSEELEKRLEDLRIKLHESTEWPSLYMFKFIVPADHQKIAKVESLFNSTEAKIELRQSSKGNFVSITATEMMMNPESIIERYKEADGIEGLISL